jgi:hypothetical protein
MMGTNPMALTASCMRSTYSTSGRADVNSTPLFATSGFDASKAPNSDQQNKHKNFAEGFDSFLSQYAGVVVAVLESCYCTIQSATKLRLIAFSVLNFHRAIVHRENQMHDLTKFLVRNIKSFLETAKTSISVFSGLA